ncbi:hypothetical protein [Blastococcus brunescens]|uniref:Uncharacterized protein n=1 Tax=Blastococcus brunescens TaxID=1564165 RepID=A0ABZ1B3Y7_9ACTN|nr:hypothetical protein [Blastococcus sp. BMG 8361]WRL65459.1 hypothetical protein U6N30_07515 [Blastococcus sp. BMG 8361]
MAGVFTTVPQAAWDGRPRECSSPTGTTWGLIATVTLLGLLLTSGCVAGGNPSRRWHDYR